MSSSEEIAGRKNQRDGGSAGGYDLITNAPAAARAADEKRSVGRKRPPAQGGQAQGKLDARQESTEYDLVTGAAKPARPPAPTKKSKEASVNGASRPPSSPRRRRKASTGAADGGPEVDVLNRPRPASPRKRGTGKTTVTFMDKVGGGLNPLTGQVVQQDADPRKSSKAKRELQRKLSDPNMDPVTHKPRAAAPSGGAEAAPYGTDAKSEPPAQKPTSVNRIQREIREMHKDVDPLTGKKKPQKQLKRSTSGQFARDTAVSTPVNPVTGKEAPPSPRKKGATTGAYTREMKETGRDVDPITGKKKGSGHQRRSSSGYISRQVADNQDANPITGARQAKAPVTGTKGHLSREQAQRPVNPITGQ